MGKKLDGEEADILVAEMNFGEELVDPDNAEPETKYTWNGTSIKNCLKNMLNFLSYKNIMVHKEKPYVFV
ncbi:MAG: hypothetical protein K2O15_12575 [Lachnospiraceae bacterium]|nr:hypothetical protein [Lachnospiraceae bacterium]